MQFGHQLSIIDLKAMNLHTEDREEDLFHSIKVNDLIMLAFKTSNRFEETADKYYPYTQHDFFCLYGMCMK